MRGSSFRQFAPISANGDSELHEPDLDNGLYADNHGIHFLKDAGVTAFSYQLFGSYFRMQDVTPERIFPVMSGALPFGQQPQNRVVDFPIRTILVRITGFTGTGNVTPVYLGARGS